MANTSKAQVKTIDEVFITLDKKSYSLAQFFKATEKQTEFRFFYTDKALNKSQGIDLTKQQGNVEEFLIEIAKQTDLRFRQVNNAISVIIAPKENGQDLVQIDLDLQDVDIQGTVTDSNGDPIPGVTVSVSGTTVGTATDLNGRYALSVPEGSVLVFSFIGFETQNVAIGDRGVVDVVLAEDMQSLDEVVVVGYGTQKRSDITGSISSISEDRLKDLPNLNLAQALQGAVPGVTILQTSAGANPNSSFIIRGRNSIRASNDPLVIVDGIPGSLGTVNPNDVESVEVLKDASAAAIYGSRGANGVVLVTTKMGHEEKPTFSYNGYYSIQKLYSLPQIMNAGEFYDFKKIRDPGAIKDWDTEMNESGGVYWPDLVFQTGSAHQHSLPVNRSVPQRK